MQKVKRTLSFILSLVILLCAACVPANAIAKKARSRRVSTAIL